MSLTQSISELRQNLQRLGGRRLAILGILAMSVFFSVIGGAYFLSKPAMVVLYSGLEPEDVNAVGAALRETGYAFDISSDGKSVLTGATEAAQARMMLAERGLPQSSTAGYELFDNMGSLGLTSFMQDVTMVRALEGELARTIQTMRGIKSARVHLVMPERSSFRRRAGTASASVVIHQMDGTDPERAKAVRYLVAAAVPGMSVGQVTVLDSMGSLLASGDDSIDSGPSKLMELERMHSEALMERLRQTLAPHIGIRNFNVSVITKLNTDKMQVDEQIFDPEGRVERSQRNLKETAESENSRQSNATTVEADIPAQPTPNDGQAEKQRSEKRDETINFEINAKTVKSISEGYKIDNLSIAVLINRAALLSVLGQSATADDVDKHLKSIEELLISVAGVLIDRGDKIVVKTAQFLDDPTSEAYPDQSMISGLLKLYAGTLIQSGIMLICVLLLVFAGIKPAVRAILPPRAQADDVPGLEAPRRSDLAALEGGKQTEHDNQPVIAPAPVDDDIGAQLAKLRRDKPELKLEQLVAYDEEQAAVILKQWLREGTA